MVTCYPAFANFGPLFESKFLVPSRPKRTPHVLFHD